MKKPDKQNIEEAAKRIEPYVHRTPVLTSRSFNTMFQAELYLKYTAGIAADCATNIQLGALPAGICPPKTN